jgi:hypothetical protein
MHISALGFWITTRRLSKCALVIASFTGGAGAAAALGAVFLRLLELSGAGALGGISPVNFTFVVMHTPFSKKSTGNLSSGSPTLFCAFASSYSRRACQSPPAGICTHQEIRVHSQCNAKQTCTQACTDAYTRHTTVCSAFLAQARGCYSACALYT